jgi:3-oxoacyl-[acyl-carrier-protein] synthase-3
MNGAGVFNFTIKRLPELVHYTMREGSLAEGDIDYFIFHQSNSYIIKFLVGKMNIPPGKVPQTLRQYGNTGGPSIPLTITEGGLHRPPDRDLTLMLLGYGVGLSWGSAVVNLPPGAILRHTELPTAGST